jgi:serine/threonine-protein kinase
MGVVYRARDLDLDRPVALKIIAPEHTQDETAVARFKSEARIAASLEHPNIVPIHRGGQFEGVLYLAMRLVPGTNLRGIIDHAPMELPRVGRILTEIAGALDAAHDRGLVHRDVKPANILITGTDESEHVYLTDFGLTKRLGSSGDLTRPGAWVGTPDYVAPEQIQGHDIDGRADVYSLGCVLYEMLTGDVAYPKDSDVAKLWAHVADPPPLPSTKRPDLVAGFDEAVARATAKDPDDRYATAGEFSRAVCAAIDEQLSRERASSGVPQDDLMQPTRASAFGTRDEVFVGGAGPEPSQGDPYEDRAAARRAAMPPPAAVSPGRAARVDPPVGYNDDDGGTAGGGWLRGHRVPLLGGVGVVAAAVVAFLLLSGGSSSTKESTAAGNGTAAAAGQRVSGKLGPVPTNRVTAGGNAVLRLNGNVATISLTTDRLLDGASHLLHIHAGARGQCPPARVAALHNGHRSIATKSGVPFYGHAVTSMTLRGDTSERSILAFKRYPTTASIRYSRKIDVGPVVASYIRKSNAVVVVHGIDYNRNGLYDGTLDRSDLDRSLPGESTAPALCGVLVPAKTKATGATGKATEKKSTGQVPTQGGQVFAAVMAAEPPRRPTWSCPLSGSGGA